MQLDLLRAYFFYPKRLHDFLSQRLRDFFCPETLRDFLVPRGCMIFFGPERFHDFMLSAEVV